MRSDYKTACILMDENDLKDFKSFYQYDNNQKNLFIPLDFFPIMQVIFQETKTFYDIPKAMEGREFLLAKKFYAESQEFLKKLLLDNNIVDKTEYSFPMEYFWFCFWVGVHRIISFCDDFLKRYSIEEVVLIKRKKIVNQGGLLINLASFTHIIEAFFKSKGIKIKILKYEDNYIRPKTIFYAQKHNLKAVITHIIKFIRWKIFSFNKKNYKYILINPGYDNVIHYSKYFNSRNKMCPQVFHGEQMPFLHSWRRMINFLIAKNSFKYNYTDDIKEIIKNYKINFHGFEFDFSEIFREVIVQYLRDVRWMKKYVNLFWQNSLENKKQYLMIFSLPPVHLYSYFLIKKIKEVRGQLAVWQHGGFYSYTDYYQHYITDYKQADYFLSFGKNNVKEITKYSEDPLPHIVEVGSNFIYEKLFLKKSRAKKTFSSQGLFIPVVVNRFYSQSSVKWCGDLQFLAIKQIVDFFNLGVGSGIVFKGLKNHKPHKELQRYIGLKSHKYVTYTDISIKKAIYNNPKFVILDDSSTSLLQILACYNGPIFLMINQESCSIREDALLLLKKRVIYSESAYELKEQLTDFFKTGNLGDVDIEDNSFVNDYIKKFCYKDYECFLNRVTQEYS